ETGIAAPRSGTEGRAQLGIVAAPWLTLWAGPRARSYKSSGVRRRWWFWEIAAEARGTLFAERAYAFGGLAFAPAGTVDALPAFSRETGVAPALPSASRRGEAAPGPALSTASTSPGWGAGGGSRWRI